MIDIDKFKKIAGKIDNGLSFIGEGNSNKPSRIPSFLQILMYGSIGNIISRIIMETFFRDSMIFIDNSSIIMLYGVGILIGISFFFLFELVIFKILKI